MFPSSLSHTYELCSLIKSWIPLEIELDYVQPISSGSSNINSSGYLHLLSLLPAIIFPQISLWHPSLIFYQSLLRNNLLIEADHLILISSHIHLDPLFP